MRRRAEFAAKGWYPSDGDRLRRLLSGWLKDASDEAAVGVVVPHAGYAYSGHVAAAAYARARVPDHVVVLNPNHTGLGAGVALWPEGPWETPLGDVPADETLTRLLLRHAPVTEDPLPHRVEHSGELQLPFLKMRNPQVRVAVICVGTHDLRELQRLGDGLAKAIEESGEPTLIVASTDMSHYLPEEEARSKDEAALEYVKRLDEEGLFEAARRLWPQGAGMCGAAPVAAAVRAAKALGASEGVLVKYATSGDASGDRSQVVGYAAMLLR